MSKITTSSDISEDTKTEYDGYRTGGLDDETAEALCQRGAAAKLGAMLRYLNPNLEYNLTRYRSEPDGPCIEDISMMRQI